MSDDIPPYRSRPDADAVIATAEAAELEKLYDELPAAAAAAVVALKVATATPTEAAHQKYRECAARVNKITDRINKILG
jgi:hypothetical protein